MSMIRALLYALLVLGGLGSLDTVLSTRFGTELWWWLGFYLIGGASLITVLMTEPAEIARISRITLWTVSTISAFAVGITAGPSVLDAWQGTGGLGIDYYASHLVDRDYALGVVFTIVVATASLVMLPTICVAFLKMVNESFLFDERMRARRV